MDLNGNQNLFVLRMKSKYGFQLSYCNESKCKDFEKIVTLIENNVEIL
jgi:hypothetical protein